MREKDPRDPPPQLRPARADPRTVPPVRGAPLPLRVVIGHAFTTVPEADARGWWRPEGLDMEVVIDPPVTTDTVDPTTHGVADACARVGWDGCDLYLHVGPEYRGLPLDAFTTPRFMVPVVCDWNMGGVAARLLQPYAPVAVCDHAGAERLRGMGYAQVHEALLWGWDPLRWPVAPVRAERDIDVLFVGNRNRGIHAARERMLAHLARVAGGHRLVVACAVFGAENHALHRRAKLVFNHSVRGEANMRSYEAPIAGACVLNERGNPTLPRVFTPGTDYAEYDADDLGAVIDALLADDERRMAIAECGQRAARPHTCTAHWTDLLARLAAAMPSWAPMPRPGEVATWDLCLEQWRAVSAADYRAGIRRVAARHPDPAARLRMRLLSAPELRAAGEDAAAEIPDAIAAAAVAGLAPDGAVALALATAGAVPPGAADPPLPTTLHGLNAGRYDEWRAPLEHIALRPGPPDALADDLAEWAARQHRLSAAEAATATAHPRTVAAMLTDDGGVNAVVRLRARAWMAAGEVERAVADYEWCVADWPTDVELRNELVHVLAATGRVAEARAHLDDLLTVVASDAGNDALTDQLTTLRQTFPPRRPDVAQFWTDGYEHERIRELAVARATGRIPEAVLRIVTPCAPCAQAVNAALTAAILDQGIVPMAVGDVQITVTADTHWDRWRTVLTAARVVAPPGSHEHRLATALHTAVTEV